MTSHFRRYVAGDHEGVWADLRRLRPIPDELVEDCQAAAAETMRRVAGHVSRLAEQLTDLGLVPCLKLLEPPTETALADLAVLTGEIGTIPVALDACLRHVGGVSFAGDCPALDLWYEEPSSSAGGVLPDPLILPDVAYLRYEWDAYQDLDEDDPEAAEWGFWFVFAPDEVHKANISGSTQTIQLPQPVADPVIHGVGRGSEVTLVEYLRTSIAWGCMPGWSTRPELAPAALAGLRVVPDF